MLVLAGLNLLALLAGVGLEYWRVQPRSLPEFNADKVVLRGVADAMPAKQARKPEPAGGPLYLDP